MSIKIIGAILVLFGAGAIAWIKTNAHRQAVNMLQQLVRAIEQLTCELNYRALPLPQALNRIKTDNVLINAFFELLVSEMEGQVSPDVSCCAAAALSQIKNIPDIVENAIILFAKSLGKFDLEGQVTGLSSVQEECCSALNSLLTNQEVRLRSYQVLALCAGAAVVILLI